MEIILEVFLMRKVISILLTVVFAALVLSGCAGTTVIYTNCTCGQEEQSNTNTEQTAAPNVTVQGAVKTGLAVVATAKGTDASAEVNGSVEYSVDYVAVTVDENGVIVSCVIDSLGASVSFDAAGTIAADSDMTVRTKNELGDDYGMVAWGGAVAEWYQQAQALANYVEGKTIEEVLSGAVNESGYAKDADLATGATIYLGGYVSAIGEAVGNAVSLGASAEDRLVLTTVNVLLGGELESNVAALTLNADGVITSCVLDSLQAAIAVDENGAIITDLSGTFPTKNQLGDDYGMVAWGGATYEWYQQAANFSAYVTGMTAEEVAGIAINESTYPADGTDLATSVTIAIGGFMELIAKAAQ